MASMAKHQVYQYYFMNVLENYSKPSYINDLIISNSINLTPIVPIFHINVRN